jgi:hypothetical protein
MHKRYNGYLEKKKAISFIGRCPHQPIRKGTVFSVPLFFRCCMQYYFYSRIPITPSIFAMFKPAIIVFTVLCYCITIVPSFSQGKVGINTNAPQAMLHVKDSSVLFSGAIGAPDGNPPASGEGIRMMWYPERMAFRAGYVTANQWDKNNIGYASAAFGDNTKAFGESSAAFGSNNEAIGSNTFVTGRESKATGIYSVATGYRTEAKGYATTTFGENTIAAFDYAFATGTRTSAIGTASFTTGAYNLAYGIASFATGYEGIVNADFGVVTGRRNVNNAYASLVIGTFNDSIIGSSKTTFVATDPVFIVGNGTADNARSNALVVRKNGDATITGEVQRPATGAANVVPICYGSISSAGSINSGTGNFSIVRTAAGQFEVSITTKRTATRLTSLRLRWWVELLSELPLLVPEAANSSFAFLISTVLW